MFVECDVCCKLVHIGESTRCWGCYGFQAKYLCHKWGEHLSPRSHGEGRDMDWVKASGKWYCGGCARRVAVQLGALPYTSSLEVECEHCGVCVDARNTREAKSRRGRWACKTCQK